MSVLKARINGQWVPLNGADEVHIGPSDPTLASTELWVDTDEPNVMTDDMRWNTAWGTVGVGNVIVGDPRVLPGATVTAITDDLNFTMLTGRRYRVVVGIRTMQSKTGVVDQIIVWLRKGASTVWATAPVFTLPATGYQFFSREWIITGDGTAGLWNVCLNPSQATDIHTDTQSWFYIEDIGPVSAAVPMVNPTPAWQPITTFNTNWRSHTGAAWTCAYRKVGDEVQLRGLVERINAPANAQEVTFTLPVGYRPPAPRQVYLLALRSDSAPGQWVINSAGAVEFVVWGSMPPLAANGYGSIDGIQFSVTP